MLVFLISASEIPAKTLIAHLFSTPLHLISHGMLPMQRTLDDTGCGHTFHKYVLMRHHLMQFDCSV